MIEAGMIPLFVAIPLAGAFLMPLVGKRVRSAVDGTGVMPVLAVFVMSVFTVMTLGSRDQTPIMMWSGEWSSALGIQLVRDGLTSFILLTVNLVACLVGV